MDLYFVENYECLNYLTWFSNYLHFNSYFYLRMLMLVNIGYNINLQAFSSIIFIILLSKENSLFNKKFEQQNLSST